MFNGKRIERENKEKQIHMVVIKEVRGSIKRAHAPHT